MGRGTSFVEDNTMPQTQIERAQSFFGGLRSAAIAATLLLLPPFFVLAVAPMLLFLVPVAILGIPFIIPALCPGSLGALQDQRRRARGKALPRLALVAR